MMAGSGNSSRLKTGWLAAASSFAYLALREESGEEVAAAMDGSQAVSPAAKVPRMTSRRVACMRFPLPPGRLRRCVTQPRSPDSIYVPIGQFESDQTFFPSDS